jgi:hypothetical protein
VKKPVPKIPVLPTRNTKREPRLAIDAENSSKGSPIWRFGILDFDGEWHWNLDAATLRNVRDKLVGFESMTWAEIEGKRHHYLSAGSVSKTALDRLEEIRQDDAADLLFSLACSGPERLIGIRAGREFRLLWWDPEHEVCPSSKKNT